MFGWIRRLKTPTVAPPVSRARAERGHARHSSASLKATKGFNFEVVGESRYQDELARIVGGRSRDGHRFECEAILIPEPTNPHDPNAVRVTIGGNTVAYVPRERASRFIEMLQLNGLGGTPTSCRAIIVGGWATNQHDKGHFGVKLALRWPPSLED